MRFVIFRTNWNGHTQCDRVHNRYVRNRGEAGSSLAR